LSYSDTTGDEEADIWDAFDEAVERAEQQLELAWENHEIVQQTNDPLSEEYVSALTKLEETTQGFDSVYEVTDSELERAERGVINAEFLATVTHAYREYHESVIGRRVSVVRKWFDTLASCVEDTEVAVSQSSLQRQMQALAKLTDAGKYGQLLDSERIELADIESRVRDCDRAVQEEVSAESYVTTGLDIAESFQEQYTDDLAELVQEGVDRDAISITERVSDVPELEAIATRFDENSTASEDVDAIANVVETYADVAVLTGKRRAKYELGEKLITAVEDSPISDGTDVEKDLRLRLNSFQLEPIENLVKQFVERETTISDAERLLKLLEKHDGSVRQAVQSIDQPTEELFEDLHDLFLQDEIVDLEVRFE